MAKLEGIYTGVGSVSSNLPESYQQNELPFRQKPRKDKPQNIRKGEIIQGIILAIPEEKAAVVRLPIGTYTAYLQGRLKKGDSLYFQVLETDPSLILKIHSSSFRVNGEELPSSELVRILDLPDSKLFYSLIDFFRSRVSNITREEVLRMENAYDELGSGIKKETNTIVAFKILQFMLDSGMKNNSVNFIRLRPVFSGPNPLHESLLEFEKNIDSLPRSMTGPAREITRGLRKPVTDYSEVIRFFAKKEVKNKSGNTFYNLLADVVTKSSTTPGSSIVLKHANNIIDYIESQNFINKIALTENSYHYLYVPVILSGIYFVALIEAKNILSDRKLKEKKISAVYRITTEQVLDAVKKQPPGDQAKKHGPFTQSVKACTMLTGFLNNLIAELSRWNFEPRAITVSHFPAEEFVINLKNPIKQPKNFSIVV